MQDSIKKIITALATLILSAFLPKHILILIREVMKFAFFAIIKLWHISLPISICLFYLRYVIKIEPFLKLTNTEYFTFSLLLISIIVFPILLYKQLFKKYKKFNTGIYGCYTVKENEYLAIDIDSEYLNEKIKSINQKITSSLYSYKVGFLISDNIVIPKFIPIFLGISGLNKFTSNRIKKRKHFAALHFIRNVNSQRLTIVFNYSKNTAIFSKIDTIYADISNNNEYSYDQILEVSIKIFLLIAILKVIDPLISNSKYNNAHYILDDSEKLISDIQRGLTGITDKNNILDFLKYWKSNLERYRAFLLMQEKQYLGAISHIFKSITFNPNYPYQNYSELKQEYTKKYGILMPSNNDELMGEKGGSSLSQEEIERVKLILMSQVQHLKTPFNYEFVKEILRKDNSEKIIKEIEIELGKLDRSNPFILLTMCEIYKFLKKGTKTINSIFAERIDECIILLRELKAIDPEFTLIRCKLGMFLMLKGWHSGNNKFADEGADELAKGIHILKELGFTF